MTETKLFSIYNASAGSGKTFTLVKRYLIFLFSAKSLLSFKNILALTFTNKAVGEMKTRIIETLREFSEESILHSENAMFEMITEELGIEPVDLHKKSQMLLETIVHNYAAFDISTIDKFNHRLIRVFAHDLKLPVNFEVELDTETILSRAVDKLIDKAGTNEELTKVLVDFAIEKADDDRSWDISYDFNNIAKLLSNENEIPFIQTLKGKTLSDFKNLKNLLINKTEVANSEVIKVASGVLDLIYNNGLEFSDFSRSTLPNHFKKAAELNYSGLYNNKLEENIKQRNSIYNKSLDESKAIIIESLLPKIEIAYQKVKKLVHESKIYTNALKNITPLSVLNAIQQSLQEIKLDEDILLISEFNTIINAEIKNQPAPFIYERMGEKFRHYFIDEFQDTSTLQWENLVPLIGNALAGENMKGDPGSLMLVGDAKQAIYRWRGGRAEQFIDLYSKENPFFLKPHLEQLPANYRSFKSIVNFNNTFFKHISQFALSNPDHAQLYENSTQKYRFEEEGYVNLNFLKIEDETKDEAHCQEILYSIEKIISDGFQLKDICIIVRKKKEGIAIAEFLNEKGIAIISSETLLIDHSPEVQFLNNLITLHVNPDDDLSKVGLLTYLAEHQLKIDDVHSFLEEIITEKNNGFFETLKSYGYSFNTKRFSELPIYEAVESGIRAFNLIDTSNAYVQFYLDEILDYSQKQDASFQGFLAHWESKRERVSIVSPEGKEAIQIMTIHKSKGLEFPVVIFPYANQDIYFDLRPKIWFPVEKDLFGGFSHLFLNLNKDLEEFSDSGRNIYQNYRGNLELDSLNLLYVVLTRAVEQLYVISELDLNKKQEENKDYYSGLFISYLKSVNLWNPAQLLYEFGDSTKNSIEKRVDKIETEEISNFISTAKETHHLNILTNSGLLWDTQQANAIERGNLVHDLMSRIEHARDIEDAFKYYKNVGKLNRKQYENLKIDIDSILNHSILKEFYHTEAIIYNERDILSKSGQVLRPDRLVINKKNEVVIIDYKTGKFNPKHEEQLFEYQFVLEEMDLSVVKKFLVYINDGIVVKEF